MDISPLENTWDRANQEAIERRFRELDELQYLFEAPVRLVSGDTIPASELWGRFAASPDGEHMYSKQPYRFAQFSYEQRQMLADLGMDVNPLLHQTETGVYTAMILHAQYAETGTFPVETTDIGTVMFTTWIHDGGETTEPNTVAKAGGAVGDIPYGQKTTENRMQEAKVRAVNVKNYFSDVAPDVLDKSEAIIAHTDTSKAHMVCEAAHMIQAYNTGELARDTVDDMMKAKRGPMTEAQADIVCKLVSLHIEVTKNVAPFVLHFADELVYAKQYAEQHGVRIIPGEEYEEAKALLPLIKQSLMAT